MKIYCSGIGGIGLSAYAALQRASGHTVLGSDRCDSALIDDLKTQGIDVSLQQDGSHMPDDIDLFVYSEAVPETAPERVKSKELGIQQRSYFQALGDVSRDHRVIAVCGTHGKSSTTAMAARVLIDCGVDPTVVVGTKLKELDGRNWRKGESDVFLLEACEYCCSFHHLSPNLILMTNADGDHFDAFSSVEQYQQAFIDFVKMLPDDGVLFTHASDPDCIHVAKLAGKDWQDCDSCSVPTLSVPGYHQRSNAQLVLSVADFLGCNMQKAEESITQFSGCWRRFEKKGTMGVCDVVDDYAHHPREIAATVQSAREAYPDKRIVCVYQPHMHDRTLKLYNEFLPSFTGVDLLILMPVYDARAHRETEMVDLEKFGADLARESSVEIIVGGRFDETETKLREEIVQEGDVVLVVGAGDITDLAERLVQ